MHRLVMETWVHSFLLIFSMAAGQVNNSDIRRNFNETSHPDSLSCSHEVTTDGSSAYKCGVWDDESICKDEKSSNSLCNFQPCLTQNRTYRRGHSCDGVFHCPDLTDECLCHGSGSINSTTSKICVELLSEEPGCGIGLFSCRDATSGNRTCKQASLICDGRRDCDDCSDELYCAISGTNHSQVCGNITKPCPAIESLGRTGRRTFHSEDQTHEQRCFSCSSNDEGSRNNYTKYVDLRRKFDGVRDCEDASDEWHEKFVFCEGSHKGSESRCFREESDRFFSIPTNAFRWPSFLVLQWVIGIPTVLANIAVAFSASKVILRWRPHTSNQYATSKICNTILVLCLCVADLVFGLQMILLAASNVYLSGKYWSKDGLWLSGIVCNVIGSMCILATQASALTIFAFAVFRLNTVLRPFRPAKVKHAAMAAAGIWIVSGTIMVVPLLHVVRPIEHYFLYAAEIPNSPQADANVLERTDLIDYVRKIDVLYVSSLSGDQGKYTLKETLAGMTIVELEDLVNSTNSDFAGWNSFGFYSRYSICMPPVFSSTTDPSWKFPVSVLCLNFAEYLFVMIAYIAVCRQAHPRSASIRRKTKVPRKRSFDARGQEDLDMQRRILWLVVTDFMCWVPLCTLSFVTCLFPKARVGGSVSLMVVIILAELDSLVNPLLYSQQSRELAQAAFVTTVRGSITTLGKVFMKQDPRVDPEHSVTIETTRRETI